MLYCTERLDIEQLRPALFDSVRVLHITVYTVVS